MAVMIAACRTLTAARPLALASRVSWFRFRAMPLSWAMKSSCSRVIRALTVPRSISWRRTSAGGCPASRQRAEKRSFRSGLSRVLTTYLQMRPMPTFGRPPCLLYVFFGVSMTGCFDRLFMLYRLFRPAGFYAGQRGRRSFRLRKHNLAFLKPLSLSDAVVQFPPVPLSGLADYSDKGDPAGRMSFSGDSAGLLYGRSDSHLRPCKTALVDYLAAGTKTDQIGGRFTPGFVVVKEGVNHRMPRETGWLWAG